MFIPTVVAIVNYNVAKSTAVSSISISDMTLWDIDGKDFKFEKSDNELDTSDISTNPIKFFTLLNDSATEEALPDPLKGEKYFKALYISYGREVEYKYYFSSATSQCYYVDENDNSYKIDEEYATLFVYSKYGMCLFDSAKLPVFTLGSGEVIAPESLEWHYSTVEGEEPSQIYTEQNGADTEEHSVSGTINFDFGVSPDVVKITVKSGSDELYSGLYADMADAMVDSPIEIGQVLNCTVEAQWAQSAEVGYYGSATYVFNAKYAQRPEFYVSSEEVSVGGFIALTAQYVSQSDAITLSFDPFLNITPIWYKDGEVYRTLIPLSADLEHPEQYIMSVEADGVAKSFTLSVSGISSKNSSRSEEVSTLNEALKDIYTNSSAVKYFDGVFTDPFESEKTAKVGFSRYVTQSDGTQHIHGGYDYSVYEGTEICAANNGIVVFADDIDGWGKVVVIDHGFGLFTTYGHLDTVTVKVDDEVKTGSQIGTGGEDDYVHFQLNVYQSIVDVNQVWSNGVEFGSID